MMKVIKRSGQPEVVDVAKIRRRVERQATNLQVDVDSIVEQVRNGIFDGVRTAQLDTLVAETAAYRCTEHPDYETLAARMAISNLHKETLDSFFETVQALFMAKKPLVADQLMEVMMKHREKIEAMVDCRRDYDYSYFGFKTLCRSYLLRIEDKIVERPQYMLMRVSLGIWGDNLQDAFATYEMMSRGMFTHASPTLFNAGTPFPQCSSCFLLTMAEDSIEGIYDTLKQTAILSKHAGGIGLNVHAIRAAGSPIHGTNGVSNGLAPMLKVYNSTARYVDQGGGKRKGSFAIYIEPWHADIEEWLDLKRNTGNEELKCRDLYFGLWVPDMFMRRVETDGDWCLFSPSELPKPLHDHYGEDFDALYEQYEANDALVMKRMKARDLWKDILRTQIETGTPYMLYKDACNRKSNQQNLGTIRGSNLCCEIVQYTSPEEVAVCNLASVALPKFVRNGAFDHQALYQVVCQVARNLDRIIDVNYYALPEAKASNLKHRPMAIGVQGLADVFLMLHWAFDSPEAQSLNEDIFETIYYAAVKTSIDLAKQHGPYASFAGSPASKGILQFDMWGVQPKSLRWDWKALKEDLVRHGMRNSLVTGPMPTASSAQILGNNEAFEPYTSHMYKRKVLSGEFFVINRHLVDYLTKEGLWNERTSEQIKADRGSVKNVKGMSAEAKHVYRTVWEMSLKPQLDMAAARGAYVDQSQSFNAHIADPTYQSVTSYHFYGWRLGLKTGSYYLRRIKTTNALQFTVNEKLLAENNNVKSSFGAGVAYPVCDRNDPDCTSCGA